MRKHSSCDGSPAIAVCSALAGVLIFSARESYSAYCNHINDGVGGDYLFLTWLCALALVAVVAFGIQHGIRYGF
jgi:hypothetical protein